MSVGGVCDQSRGGEGVRAQQHGQRVVAVASRVSLEHHLETKGRWRDQAGRFQRQGGVGGVTPAPWQQVAFLNPDASPAHTHVGHLVKGGVSLGHPVGLGVKVQPVDPGGEGLLRGEVVDLPGGVGCSVANNSRISAAPTFAIGVHPPSTAFRDRASAIGPAGVPFTASSIFTVRGHFVSEPP